MALHLYDIIKRPIITEESAMMALELNQFMFEVDLKANKIEIRSAIETIFEVRPIKIATLIVPAKRGRRGRKEYRRTSAWKKAIVTLTKGEAIPPALQQLFNV